MKVVFIIHGYTPRIGGAERQAGTLAPLLRSKGVEVSVLTRQFENCPSFETIENVPVYRLPVPGPRPMASVVFTLSGLSRLAKLKPDIIHAHEFISPATTALAAHHFFNTPIVITPHSSGINGDVQKMYRKSLGRQRLQQLRQEAAAFITISSEIDDELASIGIASDRRFAIPNGVNTNCFYPLLPQEKQNARIALNLASYNPIVVFTGRLVPVKRLDHLFSIWPQITKVYPHALLMVAGSGPEESKLKQAAPPRVRFMGSLENVAPYLQIADLFVLPSDIEGLPVSLLEAMACGVPPVVTSVGGMPEVVRHKVEGMLISPGDRNALAASMLSILENADLRRRYGKNSRDRIVNDYSLNNTALLTINLYEQILREGRTS